MDRKEVWERAVWAIQRELTSGEFGEGEFRVSHNDKAGTITVVETSTSQAFMLLNVTGATFSGGSNVDDAVVVQLPTPNYI